ncbi:MAG: VOC family protein [Chthoniobacterales bacterium]|jgi:catechol 2,3-dioxygenase-like lactoylglutathione lyase family enzyme|nr:VOC family protein [Chthoniobacterales bacterium]
MKTRFFDHIDLRVKDRKRAESFYLHVLPALGFTNRRSEQEWETYYAEGEGKPPFLSFEEDPNHQPNGTRISFWADTHEEVDRVAEVVRQAGGKVLEGPELCRDYTPDYYAFFFEDPDGNKLEICCRTIPK